MEKSKVKTRKIDLFFAILDNSPSIVNLQKFGRQKYLISS